MIDKYSQAVANAMKGKCIPYKRGTKAVLNEMLDMVAVKYGRWIRPHWKNNNYCCDCSECGGRQCTEIIGGIKMVYILSVPTVEQR